jgi:integrase
MSAAMRQAVRWRLISVNPADGVTTPRVEERPRTLPSAEGLARLFHEVAAFYRAPTIVLAFTGMRRGELCALTWGGMELDGNYPLVRVDGSLQRVGGVLRVFPPKTARGRREIPLPASIVPVLRRHKIEQMERRLLAGSAWNDGDFVFDRYDGRPIDPDALGKAFRAVRDRADLAGVRLHDLRHALATVLMRAGENPRVVSDILGHSKVAFTMMVYSHPDREMFSNAATKIDAALDGVLEG